VILDCGTDNEQLLNDDLYLGLRQRRVRGEKYHRFVDTFVQSVKKLFPKAMLHFEDFGLDNARMLLDKYRPQLPCFNDDIQGTGVVTLAAIYAGAWCAGVELHNLRMLVFGAGSAGTGIADHFKDAVVKDGGKSEEEARSQVWLMDKPGVLLKSMEKEGRLTPSQKPYARDDSHWEGVDTKSLLEAVKHVKPHILVGCSTKTR
jgi:malate dehydrogenase (oxaloacetate-decarboxylating)